ncbi:hypothetical protein V9K67_14790 [Paraflavisolibacter sp. H34]|uniref:TolB family protein n=1 Tax=Huijunlia imazamoxiresistens TaxID=3127457 RepID=UPI00301A1C93
MQRLFLLVLVSIGFKPVFAQQFGGFPPSTNWRQIHTDTARLIFEGATEPQARQIATLVHQMAAEQPNALGNRLRKINIVLHRNTTLANGYVGLAPFRSEYYLVPPTNTFESGLLPWYQHLAVHEYRHVQQYNNFNRGLSKVFRLALGQEGQALANALTVPDWFFEGDAVHSETALTPQGRGRQPYFLSGYRSLWRDDRHYPLMKLLNGSLKDYVPNHYQFGYLLANYGYRTQGPDFWGKVTRDASAFRGLVYPFRQAIRRHSGQSYRQFAAAALQSDQQGIKPQPAGKAATVTNYHFPKPAGTDSLVYVKEGYNRLAAFYLKDKTGEHRIRLRNLSRDDWFTYRRGTIAYTALDVNVRWGLTDFSDIYLLDIATKKERRLTHKKRYFTPDLSPSGKSLAAVAINDSTQTELHILDSETGNVAHNIAGGAASYYLHPRFLDEDHLVLGIRRPDGTVALARMGITDGRTELLTPYSYYTVGYPSVEDNTVYFTASFDGNDDLYALRLEDKKVFRLTRGQTGNYYGNVEGNKAAWSEFTADGLQLRTAATDRLLWQEVTLDRLAEQPPAYPVADARSILATPAREFPVTAYKKGTGLVNIHSWRPYYEDPEFTFSLYSNNVLNTFTNTLFYRYNQNERSSGVGFSTAYSGFFPVLTAGVEHTFNRHTNLRVRNASTNAISNIPVQLRQSELRGGYYLPLNFTEGKTYKLLTVGQNGIFGQQAPLQETQKALPPALSDFLSQSYTYLHHSVNFTQQLPRAVQHIFPKLGYRLTADYRHRLDQQGYQLIGNAQVFLPSFGNHSLVLTGSVQQSDTANTLFSNRFAHSRGYANFDSSLMWRASANYHLPLFYPDWGFGGILYFQRVRANLFFDYTRAYNNAKTRSFNLLSTGSELFFDTKWWNQLPLTIGLRYSRLLDTDRARPSRQGLWEVVLPVSIIPN